MAGCWSAAGEAMTWGDDVMTVLPGTLPQQALTESLRRTDAAVIMKVGKNFPKIRQALRDSGQYERAIYVERGTMAGEKVMKLADKPDDVAPYFAIVLVSGQGRRP
jgi:precorrin-2/cobalt-factor-2 C20-methyltransferase